jgi:hypothetical protein
MCHSVFIKNAAGNKTFRRLMGVLQKDPTALSRTSWKTRALAYDKLGLGLTSPVPYSFGNTHQRAASLIQKHPNLVDSLLNKKYKKGYFANTSPVDKLEDALYNLKLKEADYISFKTGKEIPYIQETKVGRSILTPSVSDRYDTARSILLRTLGLGKYYEPVNKAHVVEKLRSTGGIPTSIFTPWRKNIRIPIHELPTSPSKFTWKGVESPPFTQSILNNSTSPSQMVGLSDLKVPLFSSAYPNIARMYAGDGGALLRIPSHKFQKALPDFVDGRQVVSPDRALYTPPIGRIMDDNNRLKQVSTLGRYAGITPLYETVNKLKHPVKARWKVTDDGTITPGRWRENPKFKLLVDRVMSQADLNNKQGLTPYLGRSVSDIHKYLKVT